MDDSQNPWRREELVWSLRWLAAEPEAALAAVPGVVTADEIALDIGHWLEVARDWDLLEAPVLGLVTEIDTQFRAMSEPGNADKWTDQALAASAEWATQRERARTALALLGESRADGEIGLPRPGGPTYIPGGIRSDDAGDIPGH
jgi:hypothetical protein